ncbi:3',5'-cyclic-nucleotide phosphodiesterase [Vanrija albida]|uniref:Phosphodiesterase n=1 Tax=Vanrija albida TaxID=181172 RepID=A0ABR3PY67_9TREE
MASIVTSSPLAVVVLLPEALPSAVPSHGSPSSPPQLTSRRSAHGISASSINPLLSGAADSDGHAAGSRRLSLAPGLGAGIKMSSSRPPGGGSRSPVRSSSATRNPASLSPLTKSSADDDSQPAVEYPSSLARTGSGSRTNRRSSNPNAVPAGVAAALKQPRGSVAAPSGMGLTAVLASGRRPGAEGDELVTVLRNGGLEVTAIRQVSHLPSILNTTAAGASSPNLSTPRPSSTSTPAQQVILVPLGATPSLPSLSLLLAQGTTPTAVVFQQDLLDRARKVEEEWLSTALQGIHRVTDLVHQSPIQQPQDSSKPAVVLAYADGALSPSAISAIVAAGASGVLRPPPFDRDSVNLLIQLVKAANDGTSPDNLAGLSASPAGSSVISPALSATLEDETKVVLTPTALAMGAEHEGEKFLAAKLATRSGKLGRVVSNDSADLGDGRVPVPSLSSLPSAKERILDSLTVSNDGSRRRSVDTGRIALAFDRQAKRAVHFEAAEAPLGRRGSFNVVAGDKEQEAADGNTAQFAEVLSELYQQTMNSIDIHMAEYDELATPLSRNERARLVSALSSWEFLPHRLSQADLYRVACLIFEAILSIDGLAELKVERDQVNRLLFAIRAIYHEPNPYHNYVHAIDVLQASYSFLVSIGVAPPAEFLIDLKPGTVWRRSTEPASGSSARAREILRPQDVLAVALAAIGHDVGHPGLSNAFMKNAKVPLSVVYDDKSVLENMHCMLLVHLLRKHGFSFLLGPVPSKEAEAFPARAEIDYRSFRRVLYSAILATDMSLHFAWIQRLKEFADSSPETQTKLERASHIEEDRVMLCQALIKCADISNPARPIDISEHWSTVLLDEWCKQASLEEELSLPVSVVAGVDARLQAKGQVGFIDLFTKPLFQTTAEALPEMQPFADSCIKNRGIWQERYERLDSEPDLNDAKSAVLASKVQPPTPSSQDSRYRQLFPLILPAALVASAISNFDDASSTSSPPLTPTSELRGIASPAVRAVRVVYQHEVADRRSALARHVLALTTTAGLASPPLNPRRMSTPEALLVKGRT